MTARSAPPENTAQTTTAERPARHARRTHARRFMLLRQVEAPGYAGTGVVADGVLWQDGSAAVRWRGLRASTVVWADLNDALVVHGHEGDGATTVVWVDA